MPESIVLLKVIGMSNLSDLHLKNRIAHLSYRGRHWLQYYLTRLWGRPYYWKDIV